MNATKLTTRILTVALAVAGGACQPRDAVAAADPGTTPDGGSDLVRPAKVAPRVAQVTPSADPDEPRQAAASALDAAVAQERDAAARQRDAAAQQREAAARQRDAAERQANTIRAGAAGGGGGGGYGGPAGAKGRTLTSIYAARAPMAALEGPVVLSTEPIDDAVEEQWQEDLRVMDVLLRNATGGPESSSSFVMGIKVMNLGRVAPTYVEGAGVVFSYSVGWPLAPSGKGGEAATTAPREKPSAWDVTMRELKGQGPVPGGPVHSEVPPMVFEQDRVDGLVSAILKVLPEASNFRHLKDSEFVFVTVAGPNETGEPVRLTLKVRKSDVDAAARGTIDAAALRQRVARRVG